jgi:hypothetical protein
MIGRQGIGVFATFTSMHLVNEYFKRILEVDDSEGVLLGQYYVDEVE